MTVPSLRPTKYEVVGIVHPKRPQTPITVEQTWRRDHPRAAYHADDVPRTWTEMWAIRLDEIVLGRVGWEWEPSPSNRDTAFIRRTRFPTAKAAHEFLIKRHARSGS